MKKFYLILFMLFSGYCLQAQTVVDPGDGTLSAAIKAAGSGAVLVLKAGETYTESTDTCFILNAPISIVSDHANSNRPIVQMMTAANTTFSVSYFGMKAGSGLFVDGIDFAGKVGDSLATYFVRYYDNGTAGASVGTTKINDCLIHDLKKDVLNGQGTINDGLVLDSVIITKSFIHDVGPVVHLKTVDCKSIVIKNSTIANFTDYGIRTSSAYGQLITPVVVMDQVTWVNVRTSQPSSPKLYFLWGDAIKNDWTITNAIFANTYLSANTTSKGIYWKGSCTVNLNHVRMWLDGNRSWKEAAIVYNVFDTASVKPAFVDTAARNFKCDLTSLGFGDQYHWSTSDIKQLPGKVATYALDQNYPNPFNPSTTIRFGLKEAGNVRLAVYNSLGQEVTTLVNEYRPAGNYEVQFNASQLPSGMYFYTIKSNNFSVSKKMTLLK